MRGGKSWTGPGSSGWGASSWGSWCCCGLSTWLGWTASRRTWSRGGESPSWPSPWPASPPPGLGGASLSEGKLNHRTVLAEIIKLTNLVLDKGFEVGAADQELPALGDLPGCDELVKLLKSKTSATPRRETNRGTLPAPAGAELCSPWTSPSPPAGGCCLASSSTWGGETD